MTQKIKITFPSLEGDSPPKKVLEFVEEPGKIIGGRKKKGNRVDKRMVPLVLGPLPLVTSAPIASAPNPH